MRIALMHDTLIQYGGAERVLECFAEIFPYAHIYAIAYNKSTMHGVFDTKNIHTTFLQKVPFVKNHHRIFPFFMIAAVEQFDFTKYDIVLSDSSSHAKGIITGPETLHICYMHTPMRYAWDDCQKYTQEFSFPRIIKKVVPFFMNYIRLWDSISVDRTDKIIANSKFVARRIKKYYNRDAIVINPPISTERFYVEKDSTKTENYFLMVGRLMKYKRHDIVIDAFNELGLPLKIMGRGPELDNLKKRAGSNIEFLGRLSDEELVRYYANCRAFIFPQEEDFGIVAIEAMASGRPIIAFRGGDIVEHIEEGRTGEFFNEQSPQEIIEAIGRFKKGKYTSDYIRKKALEFDKQIFKKKIKRYIEEELKKHKERLTS